MGQGLQSGVLKSRVLKVSAQVGLLCPVTGMKEGAESAPSFIHPPPHPPHPALCTRHRLLSTLHPLPCTLYPLPSTRQVAKQLGRNAQSLGEQRDRALLNPYAAGQVRFALLGV